LKSGFPIKVAFKKRSIMDTSLGGRDPFDEGLQRIETRMTYPKYAPHQSYDSELTAPGPPGRPLVGNLFDFSQDRMHQFVQLRNAYGDVVRLKVGPRVLHLVSHPDLIKYVLQDNNRNYTKGRGLEKARPLLGRGLLTSEGEFWRRQRRMIQPAFHRRRIEQFVSLMLEEIESVLARWEPISLQGRSFDVATEMMRLTLSVVTRTLFSAGLSSDETQVVSQALPFLLRETDRRIASLTSLRESLPLPVNRKYAHELERLDRIVYRLIEQRRKSPQEESDLLGMLMSAVDEGSVSGMDDQQLRDEVMTLFLAGHETTANNLTWTFYLLSSNPAVRQALEAELEKVLAGRPPALEDVPKLVYTRQVLDESLRLYPPAWAFGRQAIQDDQIGGYHIPAGTQLIISPYVVHRHPEFWENPEGFDPERFNPEVAQGRPHYSFIPFGGGPRLCIGRDFALMESTLALARISQRYRLDLVPGFEVQPETAITLRPKAGLRMILHAR
jgi:cytochrome P450